MMNLKKTRLREGFSATKIVWAILCVAIFSMFLQGVSALSWSNNTFNNSLTNENLTFVNITECYQETANVSTSCGGLSSGSYFFSVPGALDYLYIDGDWNTGYDISPNSYIEINYTKPIFSDKATWEFKGNNVFENVTIPNSCFSQNVLSLRVKDSSVIDYKCYNGTDYEIIYTSPTDLYGNDEEAIIWEIVNPVKRWLSIPNSISALTNGFLNLSGYKMITDLFSENPDEDALDNPGAYICFTSSPSSLRGASVKKTFYNQKVDKIGFLLRVLGSGSADLNITIRDTSFNLINTTSLGTVSGAGGETMYTADFVDDPLLNGDYWIGAEVTKQNNCLDTSNGIQAKLTQNSFNPYSETYDILNVSNATKAEVLFGPFGSTLAYNITFVDIPYPDNLSLEIGTSDGINEWNFTGEFNQTNNRTSNLASTINKFLNATYLIGTNYVIPFIFHSDTAGILQYLDLLFSNEGFLENSQTFTENVSETDKQSFLINLSYDPGRYDFISADLIYNGTRKTGTQIGSGANVLFNSTFDLHLIPGSDESEIRNMYWEVSLTEGSTTTLFNSTTQSQNVSRVHLQQCDATYTVKALNFTAFDEQDSSRIDPFYFAGDFDFWLGGGTVKRSSSLSNTSSSEINFCISPTDRNFTIDANIEYNDVQNSTTYNTRNYFLQQDTINNQTQNIPLFLLKDSDSTSFILKVQDVNLLPVADALIVIQRFDPGTGNFTTVSISKTDDNGQTIGFFKTETVDYRFIIKKNGETLLQTSQQKVIPETAPFTLIFTVGADVGAPWTRFEDLSDLTKSLVFNTTTANVSFSYIDTSGDFSLGRLLLKRNNQSGFSETICDINSTSSSATLVCPTGNVTGSYTASAFITRGTDVFLVSQIVFKIETLAEVLGTYGLFLAWFIILISAFAFKFNEIAGIVLVNLSIILVDLIGLVNFGSIFIFGVMGVSIMIIVLLKK